MRIKYSVGKKFKLYIVILFSKIIYYSSDYEVMWFARKEKEGGYSNSRCKPDRGPSRCSRVVAEGTHGRHKQESVL